MKLALISDTHYGMDGKTHNKHNKFWKKLSKEIEKQDIKVLIWAGDLASFRQRHLRRSLEHCREHIDIPVVLVRGNHDFWDGIDKKDKMSAMRSLDQLFELHKKWFRDNDIHHLENNPFVIDDIIICGFDGWYAVKDPQTNDKHWMPKFIQGQPFVQEYMVSKAWKDLDVCLNTDLSGYRKSILVTHHNPYVYCPYPDYYSRTVDEVLKEGIIYTGHGANLKFLPEIRDKFDILCCGHTHVFRDDTYEGIQIYNCGSDYNKPKWLIFEA